MPPISIHALLAESDRHWQTGHSLTRQFLSTLSLRRATRHQHGRLQPDPHFYPRSPCGERPAAKSSISIHALLAESDAENMILQSNARGFLSTLSLRRATDNRSTPVSSTKFLSTLSLRRATYTDDIAKERLYISIHALLAESDGSPALRGFPAMRFLSTLSLRRATDYTRRPTREGRFLSTLSLRRATSYSGVDV